jgi:tetratricopeptide (TPR) repeat protein
MNLLINTNSALLGNHGAVIKIFLQITNSAKDVKPDYVWFELAGESYLHLEQYLKAKEFFETSLSIKPTAKAFISLFKIYDLIGQPLDKLEKDAMASFPSNIALLQMLGNWHLENERFDIATDLFSRILYIDPNNREAILSFCSLLDKSSKFGQALGIYSILNPNSMDSMQANNAGAAFYGESRQQNRNLLERAVAFLSLALNESPLDWKISNNMGLCLLALNQPASAAKFLASSYSFQELQVASPSSTTLLFLAVSLGRCGDIEGARFAFEKAIELDSSAMFLYNWVVFLVNTGENETAKEYFATLQEYGKEELKIQLGENVEELINEIFIRLWSTLIFQALGVFPVALYTSGS